MLLYTVGDSFTYGYELQDPDKHSWPAVLANRLQFTLINHGRPGASNEYIIRKTFETVVSKNFDLLVVAWSSAGRREFYDAAGTYVSWPGHATKNTQHDHRAQLDKYFTLHNNEKLEYRQWLLDVILLQNFLKQQSINYRFVNTFDNQQRNFLYSREYKNYTDCIDTDNFIGWPDTGITEWMADCPKGPGGHPLELGHARIADAIFNAL